MEEAYRELYQQFLQLRSLCMRQAALLHQLTTAQQKQQGPAGPDVETADMTSVPVQRAPEFPVTFVETPQPLTMAAHNPEAQVGIILAEDMSKLCLHLPTQTKENGETAMRATPPLTLDSSRWQGTSPGRPKMDRASRDGTAWIPASNCTTKVTDLLSQPGSVLMSELMLQSHVCDFCQAVFPGDSTTKGEFIQHLHTHIT